MCSTPKDFKSTLVLINMAVGAVYNANVNVVEAQLLMCYNIIFQSDSSLVPFLQISL